MADQRICRLPLLAVLGLGFVDTIWSHQAGLHFIGWMQPAIAATLCMAIAIVYSGPRRAPPLAELASCAAAWIGFTAFGAVFTYLAASVSRPLIDSSLTAFDASFGFDWPAWSDYVHRHCALTAILRLVYGSLVPQIAGSVLWFALVRVNRRNEELLMSAILALIVTSVIYAAWPTLGPYVQFGNHGAQQGLTAYVADVLLLRDGGAASFTLATMQGIICFPSYHTVLALLLIHAHRGQPTFVAVIVVNALMLLAIPSEGLHYLADMIAGGAVAVAVLSACRPAVSQPLASERGSSTLAARRSRGLTWAREFGRRAFMDCCLGVRHSPSALRAPRRLHGPVAPQRRERQSLPPSPPAR